MTLVDEVWSMMEDKRTLCEIDQFLDDRLGEVECGIDEDFNWRDAAGEPDPRRALEPTEILGRECGSGTDYSGRGLKKYPIPAGEFDRHYGKLGIQEEAA